MVGTIAIAKSKADHLNLDLEKVRISNVSKFQMVEFQIPTVFGCTCVYLSVCLLVYLSSNFVFFPADLIYVPIVDPVS